MVLITGGYASATSLLATSATTGATTGAVLGALKTTQLTQASCNSIVAAASAVSGVANAMLGSTSAAAKVGATGATVLADAALASATGATVAAAVSSAVCGASGLFAGPAGLALLGTSLHSCREDQQEEARIASFDCWKPVVRDESVEPSRSGVVLEDFVRDARIKSVSFLRNEDSSQQVVIITNVWDERFRVDFLPFSLDGHLLAHAEKF